MALTQASEDGLKISNAPSNGKFLQYKDDTDKLTWADAGGVSSIADNSIEEVKLKAHADPSGTNQFLGYTGNGLEWAVPPNTTYSIQDGELSQNNFTDADHSKLDGIENNANNFAHATTAGNKHIPTGGSAGQYLKYDSSGTAVWSTLATDVPAGGNTITAEAEGAIANNKCVQIRTDGKVEEIKVTKTASAPAYPSSGESESLSTGNNDGITWSVTTFDPDANCAICYFRGDDGDISFTNININSNGTIGDREQTKVKVASSAEAEVSEYRQNWSACYDTTNNKHAVFWRSNSDHKIRCGVGTMSGETLSFSNLHVVVNESAGTLHALFDSGTGRIIVVYRRGNDGSPYGIVGSYNSTSGEYDWGTAAEIQDTALSDDCIVVKAGTATGQVCALYGSNVGNLVKAHLLTISSSANSFTNAGIDEVVGSTFKYIDATYDANADRIILIGRKGSDSKPYVARIKRKDNNSGMQADGSLLNLDDQDPSKDLACIYSPQASRCYVWWRNAGNSHHVAYNWLTNTTGTPTIGTETDLSSLTKLTNNSLGRPVMHDSSGNFLYGYDYRDNNRGYFLSIKTTTDTTNATDGNHYLGFADAAYSDGQTATIKTVGNVATTLSGLTAGTKYYVQNDGTVGTSAQAPNALAGLALSATKLLIREPKSDV